MNVSLPFIFYCIFSIYKSILFYVHNNIYITKYVNLLHNKKIKNYLGEYNVSLMITLFRLMINVVVYIECICFSPRPFSGRRQDFRGRGRFFGNSRCVFNRNNVINFVATA